MTATCQSVTTNFECLTTTGVSTQEEADTIDTDVLLLALRRVPELGSKVALIMGSGERHHKVMLKPIYEKLGPEKSAALINWHSLTGCNTTGHIQQNGKRGSFTAFLDARPAVVAAIADLGVGAEPSAEVVRGCEEFLCALFCPK